MSCMTGRDLSKACSYLEQGQLVAIPTETVYGLAGNAYVPEVVDQIFSVKGRPRSSPLIVHTDTITNVMKLVRRVPPKALRIAEAFWPGPLTLLLPKQDKISGLVTSGGDTVGVRIPNHPLTLELLARLAFPIAAPSANPFGYISPTAPQHVRMQLGDKVAYILDGGSCEVGVESTIVGFEDDLPVVYRLGGVTLERLESVTGSLIAQRTASVPCAPGMLPSHYAPRTPLVLGSLMGLLDLYQPERVALLTFDAIHPDIDPSLQVVLAPDASLTTAASRLFDALYRLDQMGVDRILASYVPDKGLGRAINDRLRRAAASHG